MHSVKLLYYFRHVTLCSHKMTDEPTNNIKMLHNVCKFDKYTRYSLNAKPLMLVLCIEAVVGGIIHRRIK